MFLHILPRPMSFNMGFSISVPSSIEGVLVELNHLGVLCDSLHDLVLEALEEWKKSYTSNLPWATVKIGEAYVKSAAVRTVLIV